MPKEIKFYAVDVGRTVGIYLKWNDCQKQVKNFKNARYKSFTDINKALTFISTNIQTTTKPHKQNHKNKTNNMGKQRNRSRTGKLYRSIGRED